MIEFLAVFVSGDGARTMKHDIFARDIDDATKQAIEMTTSGVFGVGSAWFVGAVMQSDYLYAVSAQVEDLVA